MRKTAKFLTTASAVLVLLGTAALTPTVAMAVDTGLAAEGMKIAEDRKKGNCFTCHDYTGAHLAGNIGPPLTGVSKRKSRKEIYDQIWDSTKANPDTTMPPFGKHEVLSEKEVNAITEWVLTL
ncbi:MAG: sulfur oxidation c-type cytochrome SoxX [Gammaproteobacteria bacterium]|nr:sulfur oxidation c-type cytochrome SoxX [Gammaproteobacteria bacterium]MCW8988854.1 sulfur oxidation c-type cytochrome SoxX [Gammaproteobacteria bacterium]